MPWVQIRRNSKYGRILNMRALHYVLNLLEYAWTYFWICIGFYRCQDSEYARGAQSSKYVTICLNMSEFTIIDRVLNMYHTKHSVRSLCNLKVTNADFKISLLALLVCVHIKQYPEYFTFLILEILELFARRVCLRK